MALQISIEYHNKTVTYDVTVQEDEIYLLRLNENQSRSNGEFIPQKFVIRRKGKIWISDLENYEELVGPLTREIGEFSAGNNS